MWLGCNHCRVATVVTQSHSDSQMTRDLESKTEGEASVTGPFLLGAALSGTLLRLDRSHTRGTHPKLFKLASNPPICAMWHESFGCTGGRATASHSGHLIPCQCYPSHIHVIILNNTCFQIDQALKRELVYHLDLLEWQENLANTSTCNARYV